MRWSAAGFVVPQESQMLHTLMGAQDNNIWCGMKVVAITNSYMYELGRKQLCESYNP